jgi:hypothetical protein
VIIEYFYQKYMLHDLSDLSLSELAHLTHEQEMKEKVKHNNDNGRHSSLLLFWPFVLAGLVFLCVRFSIHNPRLVEIYYSSGVYPVIAKLFSSFSNLFPFSLWDVFWVIVILLIISGLILSGFRIIKWKWFGLRIAQLLAILYSFFYLAWGLNYFRPGIESRIGWEKPKPDETVFRSVLDSLIINTNRCFVKISLSDYPMINELVEESYNNNSAQLGTGYPNGKRRTKTMLFSSFFAKTGVSGYFGPFFNEVHLNSRLLPMDYPFSLAHEKAHQFGIASEAEANLVAFVICTTSEDQRLQYSGYMFLLLYFLKDAVHMKGYQDFVNKIDKQVILDLQFRRRYYEGLENKVLDKAQTAANNVYLKTNNVEGGVKNYNQVVALVISWYHNAKLAGERK